MYPAQFEYVAPETLDEAIKLLAESGGDAKILAGGHSLLPAMKRPTVSPLTDAEWVALETILPERKVRDLIPQLKRTGAEGFVEYPLLKVIP